MDTPVTANNARRLPTPPPVPGIGEMASLPPGMPLPPVDPVASPPGGGRPPRPATYAGTGPVPLQPQKKVILEDVGMNATQKLALFLVPILGIVLIVVGASLLNTNTPPDDNQFTATDISLCKRQGVNFAAAIPVQNLNYDRAAKFRMGWASGVVRKLENKEGLVKDVIGAAKRGVTLIIQPCKLGKDCIFNDPTVYAAYLDEIAQGAGADKTIYALAGPSDPLTDPWSGGTADDPATVAPALANYMNKVIELVKQPNVKLLSPSFDLTETKFSDFFSRLSTAGAKFAELDGIAAIAHNVDATNKVTTYVAKLKAAMTAANIANKSIFITQISMIDKKNGLDGAQARANLTAEIKLLRQDSQVAAFLTYNTFGLNSDPETEFDKIGDGNLTEVVGNDCINALLLLHLPPSAVS